MSTILVKAYMCYYRCTAQLIGIQIFVLPTFITRLLLPRAELTQNLMCFPKTGNPKVCLFCTFRETLHPDPKFPSTEVPCEIQSNRDHSLLRKSMLGQDDIQTSQAFWTKKWGCIYLSFCQLTVICLDLSPVFPAPHSLSPFFFN